MSEWSPADWGVFLVTFVLPLLTGVAALWAKLNENTRETKTNTAVTEANTADRAVKTAATVEQLATIQTLVTDIHKGTGDGGVAPVVVTAAATPPPQPRTPRAPT